MHPRFKLLTSCLIILIMSAFGSCMTYNYADAKLAIDPRPSFSTTPPTPTKLAEIQQELTAKPVSDAVFETPTPEKIPLNTFSAALVPLPTKPPLDLLNRIITEIEVSDIDIIGITGEQGAISYLEAQLNMPTFRLDDRRLLSTTLETAPHTDQLFNVQINASRSIVVGILDLYPSNPFQDLLTAASTEEWRTIVQQGELNLVNAEGPMLLLASLGQPSSEDWFETAHNHPYRIPLRWPYSDLFGEQGFFDSWQVTHYDAQTAPGTTWEYTTEDNHTYAERIDYLYSQGLLPLSTKTIIIGPWDTKEQRSAITGTFIVP